MPERLPRHAIAATGREQVLGLALEQNLAARAIVELANPVLRLVAERDQPLAIALADDAEDALVQIDLTQLEVDQLRDAHTGGVQHLEHRAIAVTERVGYLGRGKQGLDVLLAQRLRQRPPDLGHRDIDRGVRADDALAQQVAIEAPEAR